MLIKAKVSFAGLVSMGIGEIREVNNEEVVHDLLKAGYAEEVKPAAAKAKTKTKKAVTEDAAEQGTT